MRNILNMIEKEYSYLPSQQYKDGRKIVLKTFIDSEYIYQTELFRNKFEKLARNNLQNELISLGN
jgi:predicted metal-dependent HD superfamily phosphohydrolase